MEEFSNLEKYLKELSDGTQDPIHKRLIAAYQGDDPKQSIEAELGKILTEVMNRED
jgi:hypothetical protein